MKFPLRNQRAFTLVELLAVISVLAVLVSLLLPMVSKMQYTARSAACLANLRQIGTAFSLYATDNAGLLPAPRYRSNRNGDNPTKQNWQIEINPYLEIKGSSFKAVAQKFSARAMFCPEYQREYQTSAEARGKSCFGYGMNPNLGKDSWDFRTKLLALSGQTILVGDSDDFHLNVSANTWKSADEDSGRYSSGDPLRHGKSANYLFVDGHVSSLIPKDALAILDP